MPSATFHALKRIQFVRPLFIHSFIHSFLFAINHIKEKKLKKKKHNTLEISNNLKTIDSKMFKAVMTRKPI